MGEMCKHMAKCLQRRDAFIVVPAIHQDNAWPLWRSAQTVVKSITLERYAKAEEVELSIA